MLEPFEFREWRIPAHMVEVLMDYIEQGVPTGGFLESILENDFVSAAGRADDDNLRALPAYAAFLATIAPDACWGSPAKVAAWLAMHQARRAEQIP